MYYSRAESRFLDCVTLTCIADATPGGEAPTQGCPDSNSPCYLNFRSGTTKVRKVGGVQRDQVLGYPAARSVCVARGPPPRKPIFVPRASSSVRNLTGPSENQDRRILAVRFAYLESA